MKYEVIYSSQTGNTALLAEAVRDALPADQCIGFGAPEIYLEEPAVIFAGFWTDKGSCSEEMQHFLGGLRGKTVFLFGTAGFGQNSQYFDQILNRVRAFIDDSNLISGTYMCQGKMPLTVRRRYEGMMESTPDKAEGLLANFDQALSHPDQNDLEQLKQLCIHMMDEERSHS